MPYDKSALLFIHSFQISLAFSMFRMFSLEWSHKNLGSATLHLFFLICIGFRFATELALKSLRLLSGHSNFSSQPILHLSSQNMYRREHSALLQFCLYVFPHVKSPSQPPNLFHLCFKYLELISKSYVIHSSSSCF